MADEEPPRPKPGSLKDRIKQFEQSSSTPAAGPPPLRPKPGTLGQWKPKQVDPPSPTKQTASASTSKDVASHTAHADDDAVKHGEGGGMSASDAMSSITKGGGSLKERMAALQGKGAFGESGAGNAAAAPPLPNQGKPRVWRSSPAPPIEPKVKEEAPGDVQAGDEAHEEAAASPHHDDEEAAAQPGEAVEGDGEPKTEEEQERERRAAIAARMARLGGARLGMPVGFGVAAKGLTGKPAIPTKPKILTPGGHDGGDAGISPLSPGNASEGAEEAPTRKTTLETASGVPLPKSQGSLLTPGDLDLLSDSDATTSGKLVPPRSPSIPKSPDSMPIPALPKRTAGPRRKKSAKELKSSTSTEIETPPIPNVEQTQSPPVESEDAAPAQPKEYFPEETDTTESKEEPHATGEDKIIVTSPTHPERAATDDLVSVPPSEAATPPPPSPSVGFTEDDQEEEDDISSPQKRPTLEIPADDDEEQHEEAGAQVLTPRARSDSTDPMNSASLAAFAGSLMQPDHAAGGDGDETEEEEAVRKRRFAEKMARLGAVNPLSPGGFVSPVSPSTGKESKVEEEEEEVIDDKDESGKEKVSKKKDSTDKDTRDDVAPSAGNESETNVAVLSPSAFSQAHDLTTSTAVAEHTPTQEHYQTSSSNAKHGAQTVESYNDEGGEYEEDDVDVDYPMMSPTAGDFGSHIYSSLSAIQRDDDAEPHGAGVAKTSLRHGHAPEEEITAHERVEHTPDPISASDELELSNQDEVNQFSEEEQDQDQEQEEEEQTDMRPARITRAVPPPPRRSSTSSQQSAASASPRQSPRKAEFERSSSPQLTAALSRRAPVPPHRSGSSSSVSPTSSPPPRQFEREGAPSPPSLKALSNIEDEDETEYIEDDSSEALGQQQEGDYVPREGRRILHDDTRSSSPDHILAQEAARSNSGSPVPRSPPPPVPNNRPPIPKTRRSVPPPPESPPPTSGSRPVSRGSLRGTPRGSLDGASPPTAAGEGRRRTSDDDDRATIRKASTRPAMPPPRWDDHQEKEKEIMQDDEGDPVDPSFVRTRTSSQETGSSTKSRGGKQTPQRQSSLRREIHPEAAETPQAEPEEDDDTARRRTIAERMAKLGGIKFGMAPPPRAPPVRRMVETKDEKEESDAFKSQQEAEPAGEDGSPEEAERSRRAAITARMAAMGGRGFGMYGGAPPVPPAIVSAKPTQPTPTAKAPNVPLAAPPPVPVPGSRPRTMTKEEVISDAISRAPPVPPPAPRPPVSSGRGDDTSESEIELVNAEPDEEGEMVEEEEDDEPEIVETPPVVPSRGARPPAHHASRPPPPIPGQSNTGDVDQPEAPPIPSGRRAPPSRTAPPPAFPPSEYDMLGEEPQIIQPHQQSHSRTRPTLNAEPAVPPSLESSGQWELPNIPSGSFDLNNYGSGKRGSTSAAPEHDQSWTKVEQEERPHSNAVASSSSATASATEPFTGPSPPSLPADRLSLLGRTLARRVLQSAQMVHENSKKLVIGDGSSTSFLYIVLAPTGASTTTLGHLVYAQSGSSVLKRLGDIMPGDVVALYEAHFKGHKGGLGRGGYSVSWGTKQDPVLGIISEFDAKKSKIRAFAVNQHPNVYPMIDTPSYKLEDLKSGTVKVFRVAEDPR